MLPLRRTDSLRTKILRYSQNPSMVYRLYALFISLSGYADFLLTRDGNDCHISDRVDTLLFLLQRSSYPILYIENPESISAPIPLHIYPAV